MLCYLHIVQDWKAQYLPDADNDGHYYTTVGILLFEMVDQNVRQLCNIHTHVTIVYYVLVS